MKKKRHNVVGITVLVLVCLLVAIVCVSGVYLYNKASSGLFFEKTAVNGYDVSDMSCQQVFQMLLKDYSAPTLTITEQGETAMTLTLSDMGYTIEESTLLAEIQDCLHEQNNNLLSSLMEGNIFEVEVPFDCDENKFRQTVTVENLAAPRVASTNATMEYNGEEYYIAEPTYGNEFDEADLQVMVKDYADKLVQKDRPQEDGTIEIPDSFYYPPDVTQDNSEMNFLVNVYNSYCKADIILTFGEEEVELDWDTIQNWLVIDGDEWWIDVDQAEMFVTNLAATYNTLYLPRSFTTSTGSTIQYASSDYGYRIDESAELEELLADISFNTRITREPMYSDTGLRRNGTDDICGTYVEVNLTTQHLWYYKNNELFLETDVVTGMPTEERETITGVFMIPYKEMNVTLSGGSGASAWSTPVTYWMPFHEGQGLHDANWRSSFGGEIYISDGSHGCVNMPYDQAEKIYNEIEERTPIFLYKEENEEGNQAENPEDGSQAENPEDGSQGENPEDGGQEEYQEEYYEGW